MRHHAIEALGLKGSAAKNAIPVLIDGLRDSDIEVRFNAVLAVTRIGGQPFVYVVASSDKGTVARQRAVVLGDTLGNDYAVTGGLQRGDKVIVSGTQFLIDGAPVQPTS